MKPDAKSSPLLSARNLRLLALLSCWLLALLSLSGCESTETGNPENTGRPPRLLGSAFHLQYGEQSVEIVGAPGAVWPGGSEVLIINDSTGQPTRERSRPDGSLRVTVGGSPTDTFTLRAYDGERESAPLPLGASAARPASGPDASVSASEAGTSPPPPVNGAPDLSGAPDLKSGAPEPFATVPPPANENANGAADASSPAPSSSSDAGASPAPAPPPAPPPLVGPPEVTPDAAVPPATDAAAVGGPASAVDATSALPVDVPFSSCESEQARAAAELASAVAAADRTCAIDTDCVALSEETLIGCHLRCADDVTSLAGSRTVAARAAAINSQICERFLDNGCLPEVEPCVTSALPRCIDARCVAADDRTVTIGAP